MTTTSVKKRIARHITNLGSPDRTVAWHAERYLIRYYGVRALEPLIAACDSPDPQVRFRAAWALAHTRDARAFDTILRLTRDPNGAVRYDAAISLGILGDARAVGPLVALMHQSDEEGSVDAAAATGLVRLGMAAVPALFQVAESGSGKARVMAIYALGNLGGKGVAELLRTLAPDADEQVRVAAEEALEQIAEDTDS